MRSALSPPRLPLSLSPVAEGEHEFPWGISLQHDYLHSLALGSESDSWGAETKEALSSLSLRLTLPEHIAPRRRADLAGARAHSAPLLELAKMATPATLAEEAEADTDTAPSSPPELSYSKSSKSSSSSVHSDTSDDDEPAEKESRSEDVSVVEERRASDDSNLRPESRPTLKRPPRSFTTDEGMRSVSSLRGGMLRDPAFNSSPPTGLGLLRRGFTSPSTPVLFAPGSHKSSRSPSPSKPSPNSGLSGSPHTLSSATARLHLDTRSPNSNGPGMFSRRKSWQPGQRKTARELEAEFNDEEVEVPDDYILENVPISPMPGQPRLSQSLSQPESRSATPSPQRRPSHTNLHSARVPKNAKRPSAPTILPNGQYGSPRSPRHPRPNTLHHSNTISAFPPRQLHPQQRSKSWTFDLNEEARRLSAALEEYAERLSLEKRETQAAPANAASSSPTEPSFLKDRARSATFEISQLQKGSVMIDPLPISKEKEAVLTRTRPSWLPPKDLKEDRRHLREWEQMMARAAEKEKKRALKQRELRESTDEMKGNLARIWEQHVLPNWDAVLKEPRTRELWWRGVTPRSRGVVWQRAIGNELELSESSFEAALNRANALEEKIAEMTPEERAKSKEAAWFDAISRDVLSACPEMTAAEKRTPFQSALSDVLRAYSVYRGDVGYVYGTHLVAGILCRHLRSAEAFVALANMLNRPIPLAFHIHDTAAMARTYGMVLSTLNYKFPKLHGHLTSAAVGLRPEEYLDPIFRCLFAYHLPVEHVTRVWDIFVFEGDKALIRTAVAVLGKLEGSLYGTREEILDLLSWRNEKFWDVGPEEDFVLAVRDAGKVDSKGEVKST